MSLKITEITPTGKISLFNGSGLNTNYNRHLLILLFTGLLLLGFFPGTLMAQTDSLVILDFVEPSTEFRFSVKRLEANPIIHREMSGLIGDKGNNINGPSLIRVPDWIENPLGKYYLYFGHHFGAYIRLAYSDNLEGPWKIYEPGVLPMEETPAFAATQRDHLASPDVHIDHERKQIRMYYHQRLTDDADFHWGQGTFVAFSDDGLQFEAQPEILGLPYFRVFEHNNWHYAISKYGQAGTVLYRSRDGLTDFEEMENATYGIPRVRHMALWKKDNHLYVFFSRGGDTPEHIMVSRIENLQEPWEEWRFTTPQTVMKPEKDFEGANEPVEESGFGSLYKFVHQLRDPAIYEEDGRLFLLYSTAGEWAIGIAEIFLEEAR